MKGQALERRVAELVLEGDSSRQPRFMPEDCLAADNFTMRHHTTLFRRRGGANFPLKASSSRTASSFAMVDVASEIAMTRAAKDASREVQCRPFSSRHGNVGSPCI